MSATLTLDTFLEVVRKSRIIDEPKLSTYLKTAGVSEGPDAAEQLARKMCRDGLLTEFQAKQLLRGRWKRFIIANKYRLLDMLGQGGMGSVYLCEHMMMRRLVALKVLPEDKLAQPGSLERFQREARAVAQLDHPNIVHAYDMDRDENLYFLVMEYVDGLSLEAIVSKHYKNKGLDIHRAAHYISAAAFGLQHASDLGWVHRDIKPANILVARDGGVKILDMGLSRLFVGDEENLTKKYDEGSVLGTADYIAPEQALNVSTVDIRADVYGLGGTLYFLLTGRPPFNKGTVAQKLVYHQTREPDPIKAQRPDVPDDLIRVVSKMMAKKPEQRYQTPAEVMAALEPWTSVPVPPPPDHEMPAHGALIKELSPGLHGPVGRSSSVSRTQPAPTAKVVVTPIGTPVVQPRPVQNERPRTANPATQRKPTTSRGPAPGPAARTGPVAGMAAAPGPSAASGAPASFPPPPKPASSPPAQLDRQQLVNYGIIGFCVLIILAVSWLVWSFITGKPTRSTENSPPVVTSAATNRVETNKPSESAATQPARLPLVEASQALKHLNQEVAVEYVVRSARRSNSGRVFLNSEPDYKTPTNFTFVIESQFWIKFEQAGFPDDVENGMRNKRVRVTGRITEYDGRAQIVGTDPEQLRILQD